MTGSTYTQVTISGSLDPTGVTCSDPAIVNGLANVLNTKSGVEYRWSEDAVVSVTCNSRTWNTCFCNGVFEFSSHQAENLCGTCSNPGYVVRPNIDGSIWGGAGTATCEPHPSQILRVEFS